MRRSGRTIKPPQAHEIPPRRPRPTRTSRRPSRGKAARERERHLTSKRLRYGTAWGTAAGRGRRSARRGDRWGATIGPTSTNSPNAISARIQRLTRITSTITTSTAMRMPPRWAISTATITMPTCSAPGRGHRTVSTSAAWASPWAAKWAMRSCGARVCGARGSSPTIRRATPGNWIT